MKRLWAATGALFAVSVVADLLVDAATPGQFPALGFVGCVLIVVASKWLGRALLQRQEDYYERSERG